MTIWKKIIPDMLMTEMGERLEDGRWMCIVEGPAPFYPPKATFCNLVDGVWINDDFGVVVAVPPELKITHVSRAPELPFKSSNSLEICR